MKQVFICFLFVVFAFSCKPTGELYLRKNFFENQKKAVEQGQQSQFTVQEINASLKHIDSLLSDVDLRSKKCPKPPNPCPQSTNPTCFKGITKLAVLNNQEFTLMTGAIKIPEINFGKKIGLNTKCEILSTYKLPKNLKKSSITITTKGVFPPIGRILTYTVETHK